MDFWRKSNRTSRLEHRRNDKIRQSKNVKGTIIETIDGKQLIWYVHLQRMPDHRWPKKFYEWVPAERRKRERPQRSWMEDVYTTATRLTENIGIREAKKGRPP